MGMTNTLLDKFNSQVSSLERFPNIQSTTYDTLQRYLARYWQRTYGVNFVDTVTSLSPSVSTSSNTVSLLSKNYAADLLKAPVSGGLGSVLNTKNPVTSFTSSRTRFLVIAVHGTISDLGGVNQSATGKNVIYLANHVYSFAPGTGSSGELVLHTPKNNSIPVSIKGYKGNGVVEVNESLVLDVMNINSGGTDYEKNSDSFPYLEYTKTMTL